MYFPAGAVSDFEQEHYTSVLRRMKEPVLAAAGKPADYVALRILNVPMSFEGGQPFAVRIEADATSATRRAVEMKFGRKTRFDQTTELRRGELARAWSALDASGYWQLPSYEHINGRDGGQLVIEVVRDGEHRVRVRWSVGNSTQHRGLVALHDFVTGELRHAGLNCMLD